VGINVAGIICPRVICPRTHVARRHVPFTRTRIRSPNIVTARIRPNIVAPIAVIVHIRVQSIGFVLVLLGVRPELLRGRLPLLCLLAEPRRLDLRFLGVGLGMHGVGFVFASLKVGVLRFPADLGGVLAVLLIPLLPERLPALAAGHQKHRDERDDDDYNDDPNPGSWVHRGSTSLFSSTSFPGRIGPLAPGVTLPGAAD
jgi:hypothetical protein